jgi:hypothetical protein
MRRVLKTVDTCLPIYDTLLGRIIKILPSICISDFEAELFASAFFLSFHGFLRVGKVALNKVGQTKQVIKIENTKLVKKGGKEKILLHLPFSKNEQHGKGPVLEIYVQICSCICPVVIIPPLPGGGRDYIVLPMSVLPSVHDIFLSNYRWQKADIWSQASYRYAILWVAFLDPSDFYFLFADLVGFYIHRTYMHIFRRIFLSNY